MKRLKTYFRLAILFVSGINPALPGYSWAQAGQVIHGVYLDDTLVIVYTLLLLLSGGVALVRTTPSAVRFALGIIALGTLGVISAHVNAGRAGDLGEALRLYYLAVYFVVAVDWALEAGPHAILRPYLLGAMIGAMLNVGYSIAAPELTIFTMPTLRLGNGAGGFAGFSIWLAAWLWLIRRTRFDAVLALAATGIFTVAMIMSFSKTSVTMGTCGLAAWAVVLLYGVVVRQIKLLRWGFAVLAVAVVGYAMNPAKIDGYVDSARLAIWYKFSDLDISNKYSLGARYQYLWGVYEIVQEHPVFGVSYAGFYDAVIRTRTYQTGQMVNEDRASGLQGVSNPHSSFLYYASANGLPGVLVTTLLFAAFLAVQWRSLGCSGRVGRIVWCWMVMIYLLYGVTLPTLYNTKVMYLPAAAAIGRIAAERARRRSLAAVPAATAARTRSDPAPAAIGAPARG